jgi:hypothetical protein
MVAGDRVTLTVTDALPSAVIGFGFNDGSVGDGPCAPALFDRCLGLLPPVDLLPFQALTDASGNATVQVVLPAGLAGRTVGLQAAVLGAQGGVSNVVTHRILPAPASDADGDGFTVQAGDCDDGDPTVGPSASDQAGDGLDANCDGADGVDADGDGAAGQSTGGDDCDDTDAQRSPGAREVCNGIDDDCDAAVDATPAGTVCGLEEVFSAGSGLAADVLFVVDDSCSMAEEQNALATSFFDFLPPLIAAGIDFHAGVITTDTDSPTANGRLVEQRGVRWVQSDTPDPEDTLAELAMRGTGGAIDERGIRAANLALTEPRVSGPNAGFLRADADLHIVTISDEPDNSANNPTVADWIDFLDTLKPAPFDTWSHSIVGPPGGCATADPGIGYLETTQAVGGEIESICTLDYVPVLARIGDILLDRGADSLGGYVLADLPDPSTLVVELLLPGGATVVVPASDWVYDPVENRVSLLDVPPTGARARVRYDL